MLMGTGCGYRTRGEAIKTFLARLLVIFEEVLIKFSILENNRGVQFTSEANISDSKGKKRGLQYSLVKNVWGYIIHYAL